MEAFLGPAILIWALLALGSALHASSKRRHFWRWFLAGLLGGPVTFLVTFLVPEHVPPEEAVRCPACGATVHRSRLRCPACRTWLPTPARQTAVRLGRETAAALFLLRRALRPRARPAARPGRPPSPGQPAP